MKKLKSLKLRGMRNEEVQGFCAAVLRAIAECDSDWIKSIATKLEATHKQFVDATTKDGIVFAESILNADAAADQAWSCINQQLKVNINHYDENIRTAAIAVNTAFSAYDNPTSLPYIEEYARMAQIINALEAQPPELLERAMIAGWLDELKQRVAEFHRCMEAKQDAKSSKVFGASLAARNAIYAAWSEFAETFNATLVLHPDVKHDRVCDIINTLIDERKQALNARKNRKS